MLVDHGSGEASERGLSYGQVLILMAVDRSGTTVNVVLANVSADTMATVPAAVLTQNALLAKDGVTAFQPCAT